MKRYIEMPVPRHRGSNPRDGFTLVELLAVISIIAILAATTLFALSGVMEGVRRQRTQVEIAKLHELLMSRWESYRTRSIRLDRTAIAAKYNGNPTRMDLSRERLHATWELMRMEMPDRKSDVVDPRASMLGADPSLWKSYRRKVLASAGGLGNEWSMSYQHAECLYLIVSAIQIGETNGLDYFTESEIGDVDGDGMKEILDAWGRPIMFLRWAPGISLGNPDRGIGPQSELQPADPVKSPDPFDPLRLYEGHYALYPLIFSAGPDGGYDYVGDTRGTAFQYSQTHLSSWRPSTWQFPDAQLPPNYPYIDPDAEAPLLPFGYPENDNPEETRLSHADNITNHYLGEL